MTPALEVQNLCSGYGRIPVLSGVAFQVAPGEVVGVLGHNGMGKTTLVRTVMGLIPPTAGRVLLAGVEMTHEPTFRRANLGVGYVPQGRQIFPGLTVRDNLRMGCAASPADADRVIESVLQHFPRLRRLLARLGGALSGGEQQLLALARCLCGQPRIMLLDEPSEGIQPSILEEIAEILAHIKVASGVSFVLVEQNVEFLAKLADRVLIISKGRIVGETGGGEINMGAMAAYAF
jgi:branched-chain amino acid transport system ATP-binding protein